MKILNGIRKACEDFVCDKITPDYRIYIDTNDYSVICDDILFERKSYIDITDFANKTIMKYDGKGYGARELENEIKTLVFKCISYSLLSNLKETR